MPKSIALALAVAALANNGLAAPLAGQGRAAAARDEDQAALRSEQDLQSSLQARMAARAALTGDSADAATTVLLGPPADWTAGDKAWREHMRRCVIRYQTYDPATDRYVARGGEQQRCKL